MLNCEHSEEDYKAIDAYPYKDTTMWVFRCLICGKTIQKIGGLKAPLNKLEEDEWKR